MKTTQVLLSERCVSNTISTPSDCVTQEAPPKLSTSAFSTVKVNKNMYLIWLSENQMNHGVKQMRTSFGKV